MERQLWGFFFSFSTMNKEPNWMENHFVHPSHYAVHQLCTLYPNTILRSVGMPTPTNQKFNWFTWVFSPALTPGENLAESQRLWKKQRSYCFPLIRRNGGMISRKTESLKIFFRFFCAHTSVSALCLLLHATNTFRYMAFSTMSLKREPAFKSPFRQQRMKHKVSYLEHLTFALFFLEVSSL